METYSHCEASLSLPSEDKLRKDAVCEVNKMNGNKPSEKFSTGAISVAVWENTRKDEGGEESVSYSIKLERSYKDEKGDWQRTQTLRLNDLPKAQLLLGKAFESIVMSDKDTSL